MSPRPHTAECRTILADGSVATVTATRRPRSQRADVKCALAGAPALCERVQQVARLARHTEAALDTRDQVIISIAPVPAAHERDWELAVVLADRMVRGVYRPTGPVLAHGWSDAWHLGRVAGHDLEPARGRDAGILGGPCAPDGAPHANCIAHLGALDGHPDPSAAVASARAWFPLHSGGINDSLCWVEVSVRPLAPGAADEEDAIAVPGLDMTGQLAVRHALAGARHFDGRALGRWRTVVRFGQPRFEGSSFELALVMADRMARGREFLPRARLIASGCSAAWHAGRVDAVQGCAPKAALILREAAPGDRVLLPKAWAADLLQVFPDSLRQRGASVAFVDRIGII